MYIQNDEVIYFDSFGFEHIPKKIKSAKMIKILLKNVSVYKYVI